MASDDLFIGLDASLWVREGLSTSNSKSIQKDPNWYIDKFKCHQKGSTRV